MKQLLFLVAVGSMAVVAVAAIPEKDDHAQLLSQIAGYRNWTPVNGEPVKIDVRMSAEAPV